MGAKKGAMVPALIVFLTFTFCLRCWRRHSWCERENQGRHAVFDLSPNFPRTHVPNTTEEIAPGSQTYACPFKTLALVFRDVFQQCNRGSEHAVADRPDKAGAAGMTQPQADLRRDFGDIDVYLFDQLHRGNIAEHMRVLDAGCG